MSTTKKITTEKEALEAVKDYYGFKDIPHKLKTAKVCQRFLDLHGKYSHQVRQVPKEFVSFELFLSAAPDYGSDTKDFVEDMMHEEWGLSVSGLVLLIKNGKVPSMKKVPENLKSVIEPLVYKKAIARNTEAILQVPNDIFHKVMKESDMLKGIGYHRSSKWSYSSTWVGIEFFDSYPEKFITDKVLKKFQEKFLDEAKSARSNVNLYNTDEKYITDDMYMAWIERSPGAIEWIPENRLTDEMIHLSVSKDGTNIKHVPATKRGGFYYNVVKSGRGLHEIPAENRTQKLCALAVETSADQYEYVPEGLKMYMLSLAAVDADAEMIEFVPQSQLDDEMMIRLFISIFRKTWEHDFILADLPTYRKERGQTEPVLTTVFNAYFAGMSNTEILDKKRELMHEVIKRDPKLYFQLLKYAGEVDVNISSSVSGRWNEYFKGIATFEHAVTAAKADIELSSSFGVEVQKKVWKFFLENKK